MRDQLSREQRDLPWELVEKAYTFEGEHGTQPLSDLFEGRGQLVIDHAMFNPGTAGPQTTWTADALLRLLVLDGQLQPHHHPPEPLRHHHGGGLTGSVPEACRLQETDGLGLSVWSSLGSDFNLDYRVSFTDEELKTQKVDYNYRLRPWG